MTTKAERAAQRKKYRLAHKEEITVAQKEYDDRRKETKRAYDKSRREICRPKNAAYSRLYYAEHKDERTAYMISHRYKLTMDKYNILMLGGCEVCGTLENLNIDHDHRCCPGEVTCGKCIRGVLCGPHNRGEGLFASIDEITSLLAYRIKFESAAIEDVTIV